MEEELTPYQPLRNQFNAKGEASLVSGHKVQMDYVLAQKVDGSLVFIGRLDNFADIPLINLGNSEEVLQLKGRTVDGIFSIAMNEPFRLHSSQVTFDVQADAVATLVGYPSFFEIGEATISTESRIGFSVSNFRLMRELKFVIAGREFQITPIEDYKNVIERLREWGGIEVTAVVSTRITSGEEIEPIISDVEILLDILSVAKGTLVNWVDIKVTDLSGKTIYSRFRNSVNKGYVSLELIPFSREKDILDFVNLAFEKYIERNQLFELRQLIRRFCDSREGSFLESKGLITAVNIELIASKWSTHQGKSHLISEDEFSVGLAELSKRIKPLLKEVFPALNAEGISAIVFKLRGLNYASLSGKLRRLNSYLEAGILQSEIEAFVTMRNSLAHYGVFPSDESPTHYYVIMANLLDRLLLRLLGYEGDYYNIAKNQILPIER